MADIYEALAAAARRAILDELRARDGQTLFELCARLAMGHGLGLTRQAVSQHLEVLASAGLVRSRREGRYKFHHLDPAPLGAIVDRWLAPRGCDPSGAGRGPMKIVVTSVFVDDQDKALRFYTEVLGFEKKADVPMGGARWLTVVPAGQCDGVELLLEPEGHPAVRPFKEALVEDGIPFTSFGVADVRREHERLSGLGVRFTQEPMAVGGVVTAVFDDTCGNLIRIAELGGA